MNSPLIKSPLVSSPAPLLMDTQHGFPVSEAMPSAEKRFCLFLFFLILPIFSPCLTLWKSLFKNVLSNTGETGCPCPAPDQGGKDTGCGFVLYGC